MIFKSNNVVVNPNDEPRSRHSYMWEMEVEQKIKTSYYPIR